MKKVKIILDYVVVILVGGLFIFSGLIKLNDPIGTAIKMEEYFDVFAADFGSFFSLFVPWSLAIAFFLIILEIVLGVAVLIRYHMKVTSFVLLGLIIFFTFLTFYSAAFDKVTDCGCFGDAIKLTPWESFIKDIVLLVLIVYLVWRRKSLSTFVPGWPAHAMIGTVAVVGVYLGVHAIRHLPFLDFRPYRIGNNIPREMEPEESPRIEYVFIKDGEEVRSEKFLPAAEGYAYKSAHLLNEEKTIPSITDYLVRDRDDSDVTAETFEGPKLLLIISDVREASVSGMDHLRALVKALDGVVDVMALTSSDAASFEAFRHENQLPVEYYFADATVLKTIIRSNPGVTLWIDGTVAGKWHNNDIPDAEEVRQLIHQ